MSEQGLDQAAVKTLLRRAVRVAQARAGAPWDDSIAEEVLREHEIITGASPLEPPAVPVEPRGMCRERFASGNLPCSRYEGHQGPHVHTPQPEGLVDRMAGFLRGTASIDEVHLHVALKDAFYAGVVAREAAFRASAGPEPQSTDPRPDWVERDLNFALDTAIAKIKPKLPALYSRFALLNRDHQGLHRELQDTKSKLQQREIVLEETRASLRATESKLAELRRSHERTISELQLAIGERNRWRRENVGAHYFELLRAVLKAQPVGTSAEVLEQAKVALENNERLLEDSKRAHTHTLEERDRAVTERNVARREAAENEKWAKRHETIGSDYHALLRAVLGREFGGTSAQMLAKAKEMIATTRELLVESNAKLARRGDQYVQIVRMLLTPSVEIVDIDAQHEELVAGMRSRIKVNNNLISTRGKTIADLTGKIREQERELSYFSREAAGYLNGISKAMHAIAQAKSYVERGRVEPVELSLILRHLEAADRALASSIAPRTPVAAAGFEQDAIAHVVGQPISCGFEVKLVGPCEREPGHSGPHGRALRDVTGRIVSVSQERQRAKSVPMHGWAGIGPAKPRLAPLGDWVPPFVPPLDKERAAAVLGPESDAKVFSFAEALMRMRDGKFVRRNIWVSTLVVSLSAKSRGFVFTDVDPTSPQRWLDGVKAMKLDSDDMLALDWVEVES